jgi:hypothetical protein
MAIGFCAGAATATAGVAGVGEHPSPFQLAMLCVAGVLSGGLAVQADLTSDKKNSYVMSTFDIKGFLSA